ncbi:hypothetical protein [Streptomyces sp. NPDC058612]|uniref:hypothetical protein n=1 Tax=Streptomyces sp. NPDC058612 TaxID=3346555 RepID=UPI00365B28C9
MHTGDRPVSDLAGEEFDELMGDGRVAGFLRDLSARACDKIAGLAQAGADRLRRDAQTSGHEGDAPGTDALVRLSDAASAYSTPRGGNGGGNPPAAGGPDRQVHVPELRKLGEALAPSDADGPPEVWSAAARGRSVTAKRPVKKPAPGAEQAPHLRRGGPDPQQPKTPQR